MAVTNTPRFSLKQYSSGGDPHPTRDEHNAMIAAIETQAARYSGGATSARPAAGKSGTFYRDSEAKRVYLDDGAAWVDISTNGGGGAGAAVVVGEAATEGTSDRGARADHTHSLALATSTVSGAMPFGDKAKLDGAVSAPTASKLVVRDSSGRAQFADPAVAADASTKGYVDTAIGTRAASSHTHNASDINAGTLSSARLPLATTAAPGALSAADKTFLDAATPSATAGTLAERDSAGRLAVADPAVAGDASTKGYVDQQVNTRAPSSHTHPWADVTGKPATYSPSAHSHDWSDITGAPATYAPSAHTHAFSSLTGIPSTFAPSAHTHPWADVTGKPTSFAPAAHTHNWADISGAIGTTATTAKAGNWVPSWSEITGKPAQFPPTGHIHWAMDIPMNNGQGPNLEDVMWDKQRQLNDHWTEIGRRWVQGNGAWIDGNGINSTATFNRNTAYGSYRAMWMNSDGWFGYNLSSRKYKTAERPYEVSLDVLRAVEPKWFKYRNDVEEVGLEAAPDRVNFIAEDLFDAGLTEYVSFDGEGTARENAETINEQLMVNALWSFARQQQAQIDELRETVRALGGA